jgi:nucleotide-binding universal stress UspA family protein
VKPANAIRKILLPVDFSDGAEPAIDMATTMARRFEASVELIYIWQPPPLFPVPIVVIPS